MFGRNKGQEPQIGEHAEPRPYGVRIMQLSAEERAIIARHRFDEFQKLIKASGCAIRPDPPSLAINFHTGQHSMIVQINREDPRQISLLMIFTIANNDIDKMRMACQESTARQFASRATATALPSGIQIMFSIGVYAEAAHAFGDSLKAYVDDVIQCYDDFIDTLSKLP